MKIVEHFASDDQERFVDVVLQDDNTYSLQRYLRKFDSEEDIDYIVRELPDPTGRYSDLSTAINEAKRILKISV